MTNYVTRSDFKPQNIVVLDKTSRGEKWAYTAEWKGKTSLHFREVYQDQNDAFCPGKGTSIPVDSPTAQTIMIALGMLKPVADAKPAKSSRKAA